MQFIDEELFLLTPSDYRVMPWKNGAGTTREILAYPSDADDFDWRLSIADVEADGAFSTFPGYARTIMLLEGNGMRLQTDDAPAVEINRKFDPHEFDGGARTHCTLLDGPVRDFNVMTFADAERGSHRCEVIDRFPFNPVDSNASSALAVFALQGETRIHVSGAATVALQEHCTLLLAAPGRLRRASGSARSRLLLVHYRRR